MAAGAVVTATSSRRGRDGRWRAVRREVGATQTRSAEPRSGTIVRPPLGALAARPLEQRTLALGDRARHGGRGRGRRGRQAVAPAGGRRGRRHGARGDPEGRPGRARHGRGGAPRLPAGGRRRDRAVQPAVGVRDLVERRAADDLRRAARRAAAVQRQIGRAPHPPLRARHRARVRVRQRGPVRLRPRRCGRCSRSRSGSASA